MTTSAGVVRHRAWRRLAAVVVLAVVSASLWATAAAQAAVKLGVPIIGHEHRDYSGWPVPDEDVWYDYATGDGRSIFHDADGTAFADESLSHGDTSFVSIEVLLKKGLFYKHRSGYDEPRLEAGGDPAELIRDAIDRGELTASGHAQMDGHDTLVLKDRETEFQQTYWVDAKTLWPRRKEQRDGVDHVGSVVTYTWLPRTSKNLALLKTPIPASFQRCSRPFPELNGNDAANTTKCAKGKKAKNAHKSRKARKRMKHKHHRPSGGVRRAPR